jgi:hypothetical protein
MSPGSNVAAENKSATNRVSYLAGTFSLDAMSCKADTSLSRKS